MIIDLSKHVRSFTVLRGYPMKKLLIAAAFATISTVPAIAADMAVKAAPVVAARPACAQFGGFYLGGNVGYAYYQHTLQDRDGLGPFIDTGLSNSYRDSQSGWNAGVQGGYNFQSGCTLFGVEADWSWSDTRASSFNQDGDQSVAAPVTDSVTLSSKMRWFGTVRARSGVIVDNVLLYATGGFAYANFDRSFAFFNDNGFPASVFSSNNTRWGWTAGVGTEWAFAPNWSLKSEVLYMQFEKNSITAIGNGTGIGDLGVRYRLESQDQAFVSRIGVNYRFGGPVVARY
jgi:outer membrane immunogenic protein